MVTIEVLDEQLKQVDCRIRGWGRSELKELCNILLPGETIAQAVNGQYEAGFGMLVATDFRILLIDKKPKYLTLRDIRYDMITELNYGNRLMNSNMRIFTPNRDLFFKAYNKKRLQKLFSHSQHKVMEIRNMYMMSQLHQADMAKNTPPGLMMAMERQAKAVDVEEVKHVEPAHFSAGQFEQPKQHSLPAESSQEMVPDVSYDLSDATNHEPSDEHRRLASMMGAAGLASLVHNAKALKSHISTPFTQRWRKRPYGYTKSPVGGRQQTAS